MYGKLFEQTFTGSMYGAGTTIFAVWCYVIAHTKADSHVELNPRDVAAKLGASSEDIESAIRYLSSPDPSSRSKTEDGRRMIATGPFTYFIPNHEHYRGIRTGEDRRAYFRAKKAESRQRQKARQKSNHESTVSTDTDTDTDTENRNKKGAEAPVVPGLDMIAWKRWVAYRAASKKPLVAASLEAAQRAMAKLGDWQAEAVEHSIANGYRGLFQPDEKKPTRKVKTMRIGDREIEI